MAIINDRYNTFCISNNRFSARKLIPGRLRQLRAQDKSLLLSPLPIARQKGEQKGNIALVMALMLLALSIMLFNASHYELNIFLKFIFDEKRYLKAYNQAFSALNWGISITWPVPRGPVSTWYCQYDLALQVQACMKDSNIKNIFLMKGESKLPSQPTVVLYRRVMIKEKDTQQNIMSFLALPNSMRDFCAENEALC